MSCQRHKPTHKFRRSDPYKCSDTEADKSLEPKKMHLLFLIWEDDDLNLSVEVDNLKAAFDNGFACTTMETFTIPSSKYAGAMLKGLLEAWMADHDDSGSLLVVYYGGHGGTDESGYLTWSARSQGGHSLDWHSIQEGLDTPSSNLLYLFDCCCSASSISEMDAWYNTTESHAGVVEVIAACSFDSSTPGTGRASMTNALTVVLNNLSSNGKMVSVSVLTIHRHLLRTLHEVLQDGGTTPTAPVLFRLAGGDERPSISLDLAKPSRKKTSSKVIIEPVVDEEDSNVELEMIRVRRPRVEHSDIDSVFDVVSDDDISD